MDWLAALSSGCARAASRACSSRSPRSAATPRARPARRWSSRATETWGSIGGGNLEAVAIERARELLGARRVEPDMIERRAVGQGARRARRAVLRRRGDGAARAARRSCRPWRSSASVTSASSWPASSPGTTSSCTWSTPARASSTEQRAGGRSPTRWRTVHVHHVPVLPEIVLGELPAGTHVLIMTHDHAEDAALCDAALRGDRPRVDRADRLGGEVGAVPRRSSPSEGARRAERSHASPRRSGCADITGKEPATIAVSVAADLLRTLRARASDDPASLGRQPHDALPRHVSSTRRRARSHGGALRADAGG